jgi:Do/DeqQ family serine protease
MNPNHPSTTRPRSYWIGAFALVLVGLVVGLGLSASLGLQRTSTAQRATASLAAPSAALPESPFVPVVERALPAVVFIDVRKKVGVSAADDPTDEMMRRFFNVPRRQQVRPSTGSGFLIDANGMILTNNHVVKDASDITVTLNDRRTFKAKVVGTDPQTDVAVIKVEGRDLPMLPLGDSDQLRVGDWAIAIGNPLGELRGSVTVGIVSAQGRSNLNIFGGTPDFQDFIQTDASINFGNSGGPLCNIRGEVIGINTAINPSGQGIGFAIPINLARHVADQLIAHGKVSRSGLGVTLAQLTPEMAEGFGLKGDQQGVVIQNVLEGQPADRAGLKRNDVIVEFQGRPVTDMQKFRLDVADSPSGRQVELAVLRDGQRRVLKVTLADRDKVLATAVPAQGGGAPEQANEPAVGLRVRGLDDSDRREIKVRSGVVITDVAEGSEAEEQGLSPGEIIEEVGGKPVNTPAEFQAALRDVQARKKTHAVLLVNNNGNTRFVTLHMGGN